MKNFIFAFAISIIIHFILLVNFKTIENKNEITNLEDIDSKSTTYIQLVSMKKATQKTNTKTVKKTVYKKIKEKGIEPIKKVLEKQEKENIQKLDTLTQSYIKLYGDKYYNFPKNVKKYLKDNLSKIGKITQQYLRYPSIAVRTKQQGTNIVEFLLKPNGDISNLKIIGTSNYSTLDKNSIKTIKIAYKDYPRPKEDSLIRIYINYLLY
jgi:protein TonB